MFLLILYLFALAPLCTLGIQVSTNSTCAYLCNGPSNTFPSDLICHDEQYFNSDRGALMRGCLECEKTSTAVDVSKNPPQNNDVYWFLFNMKYTLEYCLFQNDTTPNLDTCRADCAGLEPVLDTSWFGTPRLTQYEYCSINGTAFVQTASQCASCLQQKSGSVILGNLLNTMLSGCQNKPNATLQQTIPIQRKLFNTNTVAAATATASGSQSASGSAAPSSGGGSGGLSSGAAAGIGVGCALIVLSVGLGVAWIMLRRRKANATLQRHHTDLKGLEAPSYAVEAPATSERYEIGSSPISTLKQDAATVELDGNSVTRY